MIGEAVQLSEAVAVPVVAGKVLAVQEIVTFAGQVIVGLVESVMLIIWLQVAVLPHTSVMVQVRVTTIGQMPVATSI